MPHRTTSHGSTGPRPGPRQGPWLVSLVMWSNFMRFVGEAGVAAGDLEDLARTAWKRRCARNRKPAQPRVTIWPATLPVR